MSETTPIEEILDSMDSPVFAVLGDTVAAINLREGAKTIRDLRAEVERLRAALQHLLDCGMGDDGHPYHVAQCALKGEP